MVTTTLGIVVVICAIGWLNRYVCCLALILYIFGKGYKLPSAVEMKACLKEVWKRILGVRNGGEKCEHADAA